MTRLGFYILQIRGLQVTPVTVNFDGDNKGLEQSVLQNKAITSLNRLETDLSVCTYLCFQKAYS